MYSTNTDSEQTYTFKILIPVFTLMSSITQILMSVMHIKHIYIFADHSCSGGLCRGLKCSLVVEGELGGKNSQAWWHSPPHRMPPWGLETLWHIQ